MQQLMYMKCQAEDCGRIYPIDAKIEGCGDCPGQTFLPWDPTKETPSAPLIGVLEELLEYVYSDGHIAYEDGGMFHYITDAIVYLCQHYAHREDYYMKEISDAQV